MSGDVFEVWVRGCRLHCARWGSSSAPLVIGFPGLRGSAERFAFIGERIGCDGVQFVAVDPRGRGRSDVSPPGSYGWENHARDVLALADTLGCEQFTVIGHSMGGSVAIKTAELAAARLRGVALIDIAGRVDRGVGSVIASEIEHLRVSYDTVEEYLEAVRGHGLVEPWNEYWDRVYLGDIVEVDGRFVCRTNADAVAEDRAYTWTQDPYDRWKYLTMPTLLLRATRELASGCGYVVPPDDRDLFVERVRDARVVEVDANHIAILTHEDTAAALTKFLADLTS